MAIWRHAWCSADDGQTTDVLHPSQSFSQAISR